MFDKINEDRILYGLSTYDSNVDDEDQPNIEYNASVKYDIAIFLKSIYNGSDFKETQLLLLNKIKKYPLSDQQDLCKEIIKYIEERFQMFFFPKLELLTQVEINKVYSLISFILVDSIKLFSYTWTYMVDDIKKVNLKLFCKTYPVKIIHEIRDQIKFRESNELIIKFVESLDGSILVKFFFEVSNSNINYIQLIQHGELIDG